MGMTIAEKILAAHAGVPAVRPGELHFARLDLVMGTDVTTALSAEVFAQMGATRVFDPDKIALVNDHFVPAKDIAAATLAQTMKRFAERHGIRHYFELGRSGICHTLIPDEGLVVPADLVIGADSHTCTYGAVGAFATGVGSTDMAAAWALGETWFRVPETIRVIFRGRLPEWVGGKDLILRLLADLGEEGARYKALEFSGETIEALPMAGRFTVCNMAIEAGAKTGIIPADEVTRDYLRGRTERSGVYHRPDPDARYARTVDYDIGNLEPLVACPYSPANVKPVGQVEGLPVDQVVLGSCTNGRVEDFRIAAAILKSRAVHPKVRLIAIPGSQAVFRQLLKEGIISILAEAGATVSPPTCGPCIGGHMGVLGPAERGLFTTNRNFKGRNGHPTSEVYLSGPAVAAATAVTGHITDPRTLMG
ncbi:MAG TPA: 3-isopropylmalate dehydratase large subunit [Candidatus Methylomirabilis sp.]|jgi:3-isopropylmalate/(R)-2-methylmalate dehydratase large subunit